MHIGENQLLPHSISFSLLSTSHPRLFQQAPVRSSTPFHRGFNLLMDRSCGFGFTSRNLFALFRLGFPAAPVQTDLNLATESDSPAHFTKGIPSPSTPSRALPAPIDCRHTGSGLFHSPPGVLFTFPSRYWFAIGRQQYLALDHGRPGFNRNFTCSGLLGSQRRKPSSLRLRGCHPLRHAFPIHFD